MGKQIPNLKLVAGTSDSPESEQHAGSIEQSALGFRASAGFEFVSLTELAPKERELVNRLVETACPKAAVIAVARAQRVWDLRPVVALANENGPTVIRATGPRIAFNSELTARVVETFQRLERFPNLPSELRAWGDSSGQLYFRRTLVPDTLAHVLSASNDFASSDNAQQLLSFSDENGVLELVRNLVEQTRLLHSHGVIHGHLTTANVFLSPNRQVSFLDIAVGAALIQAGSDDSEQRLQSVAPELFSGVMLTPSADMYGIGQIVRRLLMKLRQHHQFTSQHASVERVVDRYSALVSAMIAESPTERPSLAEVAKAFEAPQGSKAKSAASNEASAHSTQGVALRDAIPQGRILRSGIEVPRDDVAAPGPASFKIDPRNDSVQQIIDEEFSIPVEAFRGGADRVIEPEELQTVSVEPAGDRTRVRTAPPRQAPLTGPNESTSQNLRQNHASTRSQSGWWVYLIGFASILFCVWTYQENLQVPELQPEEIQRAWESRIASKMAPVAEIAVEFGGIAEDLVIKSSRERGQLPPGVNQRLLKIAFDNRWEPDLSDSDRRIALSLGLAGLLREGVRGDFSSLDQAHPGILLALAASAGESANRVLSQVPTSVLNDSRLPMPYRLAFAKLAQNHPASTLADRSVQLLARFGTAGGVESITELVEYLRADDGTKLQALALIFALDPDASRGMLDLLVNHPNLTFDSAMISWAKGWALTTEWNELDTADQFFVLAGIAPRGGTEIKPTNLGKMFSHPSAEIRKFAVERAFDRIKFNHPAAGDIFLELAKTPESVSGTQLFSLAVFLGEPAKSSESKLKEFFALEPPLWIAELVVLRSVGQPQVTPLDTFSAVYLRQKNWEPTLEQLEKLTRHADAFTRLYSYNQLFKRFNNPEGQKALEQALQTEIDPGYQATLQRMLESAKAE